MASIVPQLVDLDPDFGIEDILILLYGDRHVVQMLLTVLLQRPLVVYGRRRRRGRGVRRGRATLVSRVGVVGIASVDGLAVDDAVVLITVG